MNEEENLDAPLPIITLEGEDGEEYDMLLLTKVTVEGQDYVLLAPPDDPETADDESNQVVLMRLEGDALVTIADEAEFDAVVSFLQGSLFSSED